MKFARLVLLIVLSGLAAWPALAAVPEDFAVVEVSVADRDAGAREAGFRKALDVLLVRITGRQDVASDVRFAELRTNAARYVGAWRYLATDGPPRLWVRFDTTSIEAAVAARGAPVWGRDRPLTLVWMVVEDALGQHFVGGESWPEAQRHLSSAAQDRGLPVLLPLFDIEDRAALAPSDVIAGAAGRIAAASARYSPDAVVAIHLTAQPSGHWRGGAGLYRGDERSDHAVDGANLAAAIAAAVNDVADALGGKLAIQPGVAGAPGEIRVRVRGLDRFADFERAKRGLSALQAVGGVRVAGMETGAAEFVLSVRGTVADVERAVAAGATFTVVPRGDDALEGGPDLLLRLLP